MDKSSNSDDLIKLINLTDQIINEQIDMINQIVEKIAKKEIEDIDRITGIIERLDNESKPFYKEKLENFRAQRTKFEALLTENKTKAHINSNEED